MEACRGRGALKCSFPLDPTFFTILQYLDEMLFLPNPTQTL